MNTKYLILSSLLLLGLATTSVNAQPAIEHKFHPLPYSMDALAPKMSQETIEYHYGKHYKGYVKNLNSLIPCTPYSNMTLEEIVTKASPGTILNNAAQVLNHELFFFGMSPTPQSLPTGALSDAINNAFGSFDEFKEEFSKISAGIFGSGWAWLATDKEGKLSISADSNAGNPLQYRLIPLMTLDIWEHSYYIDYRNKRTDYITNYWDLVDWKIIEERYRVLAESN